MKGVQLASAGFVALALCLAAAITGAAAPLQATSTSHPVRRVAATPNGQWTTYHRDHARTGFDNTLPSAAAATAGWASPALDESVYGEPLVYQGIVYVATLNNTVYAINQTDGSVIWSKNLGAPQTSGWQCGNINPTGILGTGVIDTATSRIYEVAFLSQFGAYFLFGLDLATGGKVLETEVSPNGFNWRIQQERGALALSRDGSHVYVPFGGRAGDCGPYYGWVDGVPTSGANPDELYRTPSTGSGIWAAGGVLVDDSTGNVLFATGNAIPCGGAVNSDSVIRTAATLGAATSFFQPQDWSANWCGPDSDLGSASPVIISPSLMFTSGKYGQGFLLNPANLGGLDGQLFPARSPYSGVDVCHAIHSDATFGSFAYAAPYVFVECDGGGLVALQVNTAAPSFSPCTASCSAPSWHAGGATTFGPPIVAGGVVWAVDTAGTGLYGFDAASGAKIYQSAGFAVNHFSTPTEAGGQIFVADDNQLLSFTILFCTSANLTPASATQPAGTTVGFTAGSTGCASPEYEFWVQYPNGSWNLRQGWGGATFNWDTTGLAPGKYLVHAWVNSRGTAHDAIGSATVTLTGCNSATVTPPTANQPAGATISFTAGSGGCPNPVYEFWVMYPNGTWNLKQGFGSPVFSWDTTGLAPGPYTIHAWVNNQGTGHDGLGTATVTLTGCTSASVTPPAPSQPAGSTVGLTATSVGCPNPVYEFWVLYPNGTWNLKQGWGGGTFNWDTTGLLPGNYLVHAWANQQGAATTLEVYGSSAVTLTPCTSASLAPTSATQAAGSTVPFTASSTGCPNPVYEFWVLYPNGTWNLTQGFGSATFNWDTTGLRPGDYIVHVWVNNQGTGHEALASASITLTGCTSATINPPSGSAAVGTTITFTASAIGCPNPVYEFWLQYPDGTWHLEQAFSNGSNTWLWASTGLPKGNYVIHAWANNQGADTSSLETYGIATYTLN